MKKIKIFDGEIIEGVFLSRKNRFVVECKVNNEIKFAYLPNPGRLLELLLENVTVYLKPNEKKDGYEYILIGVQKDDIPVMLHTHFSNKVFKFLLENQLIEDFENCKVLKEEFSVGNSRFDFLINCKMGELLLEVKTCTLFHNDIAMFPDAATKRGTKHLKELAQLSKCGTKGAVIFFVQTDSVKYFLPEFNIDLDFAKTLFEVKNLVLVKAYGIGWEHNLTLKNKVKELKIPWNVLKTHINDSGSYILILKLEKDTTIEIGELGNVFFKKGYYAYVGSGKKFLSKRVDRHRKVRKKMFWHIDYFREHCEYVTSFIIRTSKDIECILSEELKKISDWRIQNFGCSDCNCISHLYGFSENPLLQKSFIELLMKYRLGAISEEIKILNGHGF